MIAAAAGHGGRTLYSVNKQRVSALLLDRCYGGYALQRQPPWPRRLFSFNGGLARRAYLVRITIKATAKRNTAPDSNARTSLSKRTLPSAREDSEGTARSVGLFYLK